MRRAILHFVRQTFDALKRLFLICVRYVSVISSSSSRAPGCHLYCLTVYYGYIYLPVAVPVTDVLPLCRLLIRRMPGSVYRYHGYRYHGYSSLYSPHPRRRMTAMCKINTQEYAKVGGLSNSLHTRFLVSRPWQPNFITSIYYQIDTLPSVI